MAENMRGNPPIYSKNEIERYFERLRIPANQRIFDVSTLGPDDALMYLEELQKRSLVAIPFENLSLHYSEERRVSLNVDDVFDKIIGSGCRGGYCMENNLLFSTLLRSLGFELYTAGGRVFEGGLYGGWGHMVTIVRISQNQYVVDTGFGANGPVRPLMLDRETCVTEHIAPASHRLLWESIPGSNAPEQKLWRLQFRINDDAEWQDMYCFPELEFTPRDYEGMNYRTSTNHKSLFMRELVCVRMLFGEDESNIIGVVILQHELKRREHGKTTLQKTFESEQDRVQALADHFGINLTLRQRAAIRGLASCIGGGFSFTSS